MLLAVESNPDLEHSRHTKLSVRSPEILFNMSEETDQNGINLEIEKANDILELNNATLSNDAINKSPIESMDGSLSNFNNKTEGNDSYNASHIINGISESDDKEDTNLELEINNMINSLSKNDAGPDACTNTDISDSLFDNGTESDVPINILENSQSKVENSLNVSPIVFDNLPDTPSVVSSESSNVPVKFDMSSKLNKCVVDNVISDINKTAEQKLETLVNDILCEKGIETDFDICEKEINEADNSDCNNENNFTPINTVDEIAKTELLPLAAPDSPIKFESNKLLTNIQCDRNAENNMDSDGKSREALDSITLSESTDDTVISNINCIKPVIKNETEATEFSVGNSEEKSDADSFFDSTDNIIKEIKMEVDSTSPILKSDHMVYIASPDVFLKNEISISESLAELNSLIKNEPEAMECADISFENKLNEEKSLSAEEAAKDLSDFIKDVDSTKDTSKVIDTLDLVLSDDDTDASKLQQSPKKLKSVNDNVKNTNLLPDEDLLLVLNDKEEDTATKTNIAVDNENEKVGTPVIENDNASQIILDDDDDDVLPNKSVNDVSKNVSQEKNSEKTTFDKLLDSDIEVLKENSSTEINPSLKDIENDLGMDLDVPNLNVTVEKEKATELIIPLNFMKTFKSSLGKMTRDDLEEYCLVKIVEAIVKRSNLSEAESKLKTQMNNIDALRKKLAHITKQNRDLEIVMKNLCSEHKRRKEELIEPVKISRSVGFQVGPSSVKNKTVAKPSVLPTPSTTTPKPTKATKSRQTNSNSSSTPSNTENSPNSQRKIPISNSARQIEDDRSKTVKNNITPILKSALSVNNQNVNNNNAQKQLAEKRVSDSSIDLTDDEPPAKQMALNNRTKAISQSKLPTIPNGPNSGNKLYMMNSHIQQFPNAKPVFRPRHPMNNQAIPIPSLRPIAQPQPRLGIPIKTVGPNSPLPQHRNIQPSFISNVYQKHPAPLPVSRTIAQTSAKFLPPKPELKISKVSNGIVISWVMETGSDYHYDDIASYQIYAYQETSALPHTDLWKKIGDVKALPLPMACTLTQFMAGYKYYFAVRAVDVKSKVGPFSLPGYILLNNDK